jgi:hypothetical protein
MKVYEIDEENFDHNEPWRFEALYKSNAKGLPVVWWSGYDTEKNSIITVYGAVDGKLKTTFGKPITEGKAKRSIDEEAVVKIQRTIKTKLKGDYVTKSEYDFSSVPVPKVKAKAKAKKKEESSGRTTRVPSSYAGEDPGDDLATYEVNEEDEIDFEKSWRFTPLYKPSATGAELMWWIGFDPETDEIMSGHGQVGGKIQVSRTEVELNRSGRDMKAQALQQIRQKVVLKKRTGYRGAGEEAPTLRQPLLLGKYNPEKTKLNFPVGLEPKLDGVRAIASIGPDGKVSIRSRAGVEWHPDRKWHFEEEIALLLSFLPGSYELEGEMFGTGIIERTPLDDRKGKKKGVLLEGEWLEDDAVLSEMVFEDIVSAVKNTEVMDEIIDSLSYNIFTYTDPNLPAEFRYEDLEKAFKLFKKEGGNMDRLKLIPMVDANTKDEIWEKHLEFLDEGYEGTVIYKFANDAEEGSMAWNQSLYVDKRSANIMKYKATADGDEMHEDEGTITGFYESSGNQKGAIMFNVVTDDGIDFNVGLKGTIEYRRQLYKIGDELIGKRITYMYQAKSKNGTPRFPVGKAVRDYEE